MGPICLECEYDYRSVRPEGAPSVLRREAAAFAYAVRTRTQIRPVAEGTWTPIEYAGHVRDVLLVTRERTLTVRLGGGRTVVPMGRDERVAWGEYDGLTAAQIAQEIGLAGEWLAHTWDRLSAGDWDCTLLYNYPEPQTRPLSWLAAHVVHELVHHRLDIERLTSPR